MKNVGRFLLFLFILTTVPAYASDVTLFGGIQREGKLTLRNAVQQGTSNVTFDPRTFGVFGFRFGHGKLFGGEHTLAYTPNFVESRMKAVIYNSNLFIQAPIPKVKPYATAGLGGVFTFGDSPFDIGNKFAVNYGGGIKVLPAGPVGIRFDVRGYAIPSVQSQTLNVLEVTVGAVFAF
ncbi:MAG TPA: hypothetical protein VE422_30045 [Terriglobia bacterium]|nr:hypothetical protein [Terriglobia bacterium]